ncbi:MAG: VCBS repeat-containing protein [Pseudomonadota bacterium]
MFLALLLGLASPPVAADIAEARYERPTDRYPHGVLGDPSEYTDLVVRGAVGGEVRYRWERPMVFEDVAPRLVDIDGDGSREVLVVESHERQGARFAVYALRDGALIPLVRNPFIGTRFRWLAIVGAEDLDGDGQMEIAYVDRPHLAKTLRVWEVRALDATTFTTEEEASLPGVTNHRIGEVDIAGGIRDCGAGPEMIVADANWLRVLAVRFDGALRARELGPHGGRASFAQAMGCVE